MSVEALDVLAYRGYLKGAEVLACEFIGFTPYVPKPLTSGANAGAVRQAALHLVPENDTYHVLPEKR